MASNSSSPLVTGASAFVRSLAQAGVSICFANPGTTEMHLVGALDEGKIRPVLGLQETVCTGAADGFARMTSRPAMVLLHLGPGLANGIANLHNARRAGSPVVCVVGEMAEWHVESDAPLCMNIEALAGTVSKTVIRTASAESLGAQAELAVRESLSFGAVMGSKIVTVIVPHNQQWEKVPWPACLSSPAAAAGGGALLSNSVCSSNGCSTSNGNGNGHGAAAAPPGPGFLAASVAFVKDCAKAIQVRESEGHRVEPPSQRKCERATP